MQEKVKIINLQEKVIQLSEENKKAMKEIAQLKMARQQGIKKLKLYERLIDEQIAEAVKQRYLSDTDLDKISQGDMDE